MTNNENFVYKSKNTIYFKLIYIIFISIMILLFLLILRVNPGSAILMMAVVVIPGIIILYYFMFVYIKPDFLYQDRIEGNIDQLNLKTKERDKIEKLLFKNINEIYFPNRSYDRHFYFRYNKNYEISFLSIDGNLQDKLKELLIDQYNDKIIATDEEFKTSVEKSLKLLFSIAIIYGICIIIGAFLLHQYVNSILLTLLEIVIWTIILAIFGIYNFKVIEKKGLDIWNL